MNKTRPSHNLQLPESVVFVLGAGVDAALGLPLMNSLFRELNTFAKGEGKSIDKAIRKHVNVRFNLAAYAGDEGEHLGKKLLGSHVHLLPIIQKALERHPNQGEENVRTIKTIVKKLQAIATANELTGATATQLQKIAGEVDGGAAVDKLLNPDNIELQPIARQAVRKMFTAVLGDLQALSEAERAAFETLVAALSNFEEMLGEFFAGYFTKTPSSQKRYFYLSWLLWAYIRVKERAGGPLRGASFYKTLSEVGRRSEVITFNYTDFFCSHTRPRDGYFHGDSRSYIQFDTREYIWNNPLARDANTVDKISDFISSLSVEWGGDPPKTYLPAIVPPLSVKPIICTEYLERWYKCGQIIKKAKSIVILGYSFSVADEHFNDLIRKQNQTASLLIINPSLDSVIDQVCRITNFDKALLTHNRVEKLECLRGGRLTFVKARAEEIQPSELIRLVRNDNG